MAACSSSAAVSSSTTAHVSLSRDETKLQKSGVWRLDTAKTEHLVGATLIANTSDWVMYQHSDGSHRRMHLISGEVCPLWPEIEAICKEGDVSKWMFHSTSSRLLVAVKVPKEQKSLYPIEKFGKRVRVVALDSTLKVRLISQVIQNLWKKIGDCQFLGAWEGEKSTLVVAMQNVYKRNCNCFELRVGAYDIINGEFLHGYSDVHSAYTPLRQEGVSRGLPFAFNPIKNRFIFNNYSGSEKRFSYRKVTVALPRDAMESYTGYGYKCSLLVHNVLSSGSATFLIGHDPPVEGSEPTDTIDFFEESILTIHENIKQIKRDTEKVAMLGEKLLIASETDFSLLNKDGTCEPLKSLITGTPKQVITGKQTVICETSEISMRPTKGSLRELVPVIRVYSLQKFW